MTDRHGGNRPIYSPGIDAVPLVTFDERLPECRGEP